MDVINLVGVKINTISENELVSRIELMIRESKRSSYVCFSNAHTLVLARRDKLFKDAYDNADIIVPDGMPLIWLGKLKGYKNMIKCSGPDIMERFFEKSQSKGYSHYFYGSTQDTLDKLEVILKRKFPNINIVGKYSPPFRDVTDEEMEDIIYDINALKPDLVWVGLGAPKQELWMRKYSNRLGSSILLGVGAGFDFQAGTVKRAPKWMQKSGLEWFYRLIKEPKRLWKRYLITNTLFLMYSFVDLFIRKANRKNKMKCEGAKIDEYSEQRY